jgi:hypothetical protein
MFFFLVRARGEKALGLDIFYGSQLTMLGQLFYFKNKPVDILAHVAA